MITEYGIAYLHGKSIRERAMDLIAIAHPDFRKWLIEEAKRLSLIYPDQAFVSGRYPEELETSRTTRTGLKVLLRPVKISDEPLIRDLFYSLSEDSIYQRFLSARRDMPHKMRQSFVAIDYANRMIILAAVEKDGKEIVAGLGQYDINADTYTADIALLVRDEYQNQGVGSELLSYLTYLAKRQGLLGFTAEVLVGNDPVLRLFNKAGFLVDKRNESGVFEMKAMFK